MKTHLVLSVGLLLSVTCFGQKIKVKKNIVCKDNLPVLRIEKVSVKRPKFMAEKAVISIDNDTLAWLSKKFAYIPKANYEYEERMLSYYEFELYGIDSVMTYVYNQQDEFYMDLARINLIDEDSLSNERWNLFNNIFAFKLAALDLFSQALEVREKLMAEYRYPKYVENNTARNPNAELSIANNIIAYKSSKEMVPSGIGAIERIIANGRTQYNVYNSRAQKLMATIEFDIVPGQVTINTEFDHSSINLAIPKGELGQMLLVAVRFLLDAGYI